METTLQAKRDYLKQKMEMANKLRSQKKVRVMLACALSKCQLPARYHVHTLNVAKVYPSTE
jgi:hypothetical protein